ncbi:uncharacterized protein Triagg1_3925 [Trichoderma aggressivum f. europaeum]|uniref:Transcription factor domain-containing protein n=1 Tax=Trichoderma aggressivum f. europaeum TaxID=173218 RepID=A0AAE1JBX5_9HYPO|nr:hypothetical protein Triagg1_3925 [Trichoderma aggressivum f. europaeum]
MSTASTENAASNDEAGAASPTGLNRTCEVCLYIDIYVPSSRRRRNKNDTRIKALEQKLQELQDAISETPAQLDTEIPYPDPLDSQFMNTSLFSDPQQQSTSLGDSLPPLGFVSTGDPYLTSDDPVSVGLVSSEFAHEMFSTFCVNMASIYPLVLFPSHWTWQHTRSIKPALFRAVLSVASSSHEPECCKMLFRDTAKYVAEEVAVHGNRSLDLVQAYLVLSAWYFPMENFQKLMFSQYANMAATLVLDLKSSNDEQYKIPSANESFLHSEQLIETCRTFIACYFLSSSMAFSWRRPSVLRHEPWLDDCISVLETAPNVHPNDRRLIEWTKLQIIAEESMSATGLYSGAHVNFSDDSICRVLKYGVDRVTAWKRQVSTDIIHKPMIIHYHMILISLHEPAFYDGHDMEDFRPPYKLRPLPLAKNLDNYYSLNVANSLAQCVASAQKVIHTFLDIPIEILQIMPVIVFTRITYAAVILMKFDVSARVPQSVACLLDDIEFNPKVLLLQLLNKLTLAEGSKRLVVPSVFRGALSRMTRWYIDQFESLQAPDQGDIFEPMMHVGIDAQRSPDTGLSHTGSVTSDTSILPLHHFHKDYL